MKITRVTKEDFTDWFAMARLFWLKHTEKEIKEEFKRILNSKKEESLIARDNDGSLLGFITISIRSDYVEGAKFLSKVNPVGYLEAIYIKKEHRKKGIARQLMKEAEQWFSERRVLEIGSDVEIHNLVSQKFHKNMGFKKGETLVHYLKKI